MFWRLFCLSIGLFAIAGCASTKYHSAVPEALIQKESAKVPVPLWKFPLGNDAIVNLELVGEDRMLLKLRPDEAKAVDEYSMMLDRKTGRKLWEFRPDNEKSRYSTVLLLREMVFYLVKAKEAELIAIDLDDGNILWRTPAKNTRLVQFFPKEACLILSGISDEGVSTTSISLDDGAIKWNRSHNDKDFPFLPTPLVSLDSILSFYGGVSFLSPKNGKVVWQRQDITLGPSNPPPVLEASSLFILDKGNKLHALDVKNGHTLWTHQQDENVNYSSIGPVGRTLYLRGKKIKNDDQPAYVVDSVSAKDGKRLWRHSHYPASVSNIVEHKGKTFFATRMRFFSVNAQNGKELYVKEATNTSGFFQNRLRILDEKVIFIGEMMVAAYEAESGKEVYSIGMNPVSTGVSLSALENEISKTKGNQVSSSNTWGGIAASMSNEAALSQSMANNYYKIASQKRQQSNWTQGLTRNSNLFAARTAAMQGQINAAFAKSQAIAAFQAATWQASEDLAAMVTKATTIRVGEKALLRKSTIQKVYGDAENDKYVYRPTEYDYPGGAPFVGVTVIDLKTGNSKQSLLSPKYQHFGLWTIIDWDEGISYTQGIGLDPSKYEYGETQFFADFYKTFLIARPVKMP